MTRTRIALAFLFALSLLPPPSAFAQDSEKPVKMKDLPEAVQKTVHEQSKGATIRGLTREVEHGKTFYEVELKVDGHNKDVLIDPTGAVVEVEEVVALASLPPAVKAGIEKHAAGGTVVMVESVTRKDAVVAYEAHVKTGAKYSEVKVGPDGQLIATEEDEDDDEDQ